MQATQNQNQASGASSFEEWRPIPGLESYEVSDIGRIRRAASGKGTRAGKLRVPYALPSGYLMVDLYEGGKRTKLYVHRAVAAAFHGLPPTPKHEAAHRNRVVSDNRKDNIRWATHQENEADKIGHGTLMKGSGHANSKLTEAEVSQIRKRRADGETLTSIAEAFGIGFQNVGLICQGKTWTHVQA